MPRNKTPSVPVAPIFRTGLSWGRPAIYQSVDGRNWLLVNTYLSIMERNRRLLQFIQFQCTI